MQILKVKISEKIHRTINIKKNFIKNNELQQEDEENVRIIRKHNFGNTHNM